MQRIEKVINELYNIPSDINEHFPTLIKYASECNIIVEMGVRWITATYCFLGGLPKKLTSYDMHNPSNWGKGGPGENQGIIQRGYNTIEEVEEIAKELNINYQFIQANVLNVEIEETDLLFLDTWHAYSQLSKELALHSPKVKKYIILHDTKTYQFTDETNYEVLGPEWKAQGIGLQKAIDEFLQNNPNWEVKEIFENNNGLTILQRLYLEI